jgi:hypothetical protein
VGAVVAMFRVTDVLLIAFPLPGLKVQLASEGILLCKQVYVTGRTVVELPALIKEGEPVLLTVIGTCAVAPGATE